MIMPAINSVNKMHIFMRHSRKIFVCRHPSAVGELGGAQGDMQIVNAMKGKRMPQIRRIEISIIQEEQSNFRPPNLRRISLWENRKCRATTWCVSPKQ
jgi:hypothetical protein